MQSIRLLLVSHALCPYVQRAAILLAEKHMPFERIDIDLANKPEWFLRISPLGKTPVLMVGDVAVFESAVICEYLDESAPPRLHPDDLLEKAQHRSWMEFGSALLNAIAAFYAAPDEEQLIRRAADITRKFEQLEARLGRGSFFAGDQFSMVDVVFGPVFRYFDVFERIGDFGFFDSLPRVCAWRAALAARDSVGTAVPQAYPDLLWNFLHRRGGALSARMVASGAHRAATALPLAQAQLPA
jgi:glutathione S-transferase